MAQAAGFRDNRGMNHIFLSRRRLLAGLAGLTLGGPAWAVQPIDAEADFGVTPDILDDQSRKLQAALDAAHGSARTLMLPGGQIFGHDLAFPGALRIVGQPGKTVLISSGPEPVGKALVANDLIFDSVGFSGGVSGGAHGLLQIESSVNVLLTSCSFVIGAGNGVLATDSAVTISDCVFDELGDAAIHSLDSRGMMMHGNRISRCASAGIRIWRSASGADGSIVSGNRISAIDWKGGGDGQNGNGVNVFQADDVIVADNVISDCAFTAVRVNAGRNNQIRGNTCLNSGEVAIFSEFGFSGSVIADNIIDGAATGISITNLDSGGHLATCTGNIVRNIAASSAVNPDTRPVGMFAEADTVIANNTVENVPGYGIVAGFGPFVRNVTVSDNVIVGVDTGIGVSVVQEQAPGPVRVSGNIIGAGAKHGIVGMEWEKVVSEDLAGDGNYPNVTVSDNTIG